MRYEHTVSNYSKMPHPTRQTEQHTPYTKKDIGGSPLCPVIPAQAGASMLLC
jgi:hypothetical protein